MTKMAQILFLWSFLFVSAGFAADPVTANSSVETKVLLQLLYDISGHNTLTGQHSYPKKKDILGNGEISNVPYQLDIYFTEAGIHIQKTIITEFADNRTTMEMYTVDGSEITSTFWNVPGVTSAEWTGNTLSIKSKTTFVRGNQVSESISSENWSLTDGRHSLQIKQFSKFPWGGERELLIVFDRQKQ